MAERFEMEKFVARKETFVAQKETFVAQKETFVAREETFVAQEETFVARKETFVARMETFVSRNLFSCYRNLFECVRNLLIKINDNSKKTKVEVMFRMFREFRSYICECLLFTTPSASISSIVADDMQVGTPPSWTGSGIVGGEFYISYLTA